MPTVLRSGPYRLFFYSGDRDDASLAKFWLDPVRLVESGGFGRTEIRRVEVLVRNNANQLRRAWDEYFTE
jgi:hypothetical protein